MTSRIVQIIPFCSAKGGVGKSTLAVTLAGLLARRGETVVVLDLDMTGTSLADGMALEAPALPEVEPGSLDLTTPPSGRWLSREATERGRRQRNNEIEFSRRKFIPFINDIFHIEGITSEPDDEPIRLDSLLWRACPDDGVRYLLSSPVDMDVSVALHQLYIEERDDWERQLTWLIYRLAEQLPNLSAVVLDLPPGLHGFSDRALHAAATLALGLEERKDWPPAREDLRWRIHPMLVTSQDKNDLRVALDWPLLYDEERLPNVLPVVNRVTVRRAEVREYVRGEFGPIDERLVFIDADPSALGRLFWDGQVDLRRVEDGGAFAELLSHLKEDVG